MKKILYLLAFAVLAFVFLNGCEDRSDITGVEPILDGKSGDADLTRFVAIGNSLTAGYQSAALYESAQVYSFGNLLAKQVSTKFAMPIYSDPGSGGRMEIQALTATGAVIIYNTNTGTPTNLTYPAPYNNLGVPGALIYDVLNATNSTDCFSAVYGNSPNPFFDLILRNSALNLGTQLEQALVQQPTFVTLWIGNNDVLGYATSGGVSPPTPTDKQLFTSFYNRITKQLEDSSEAQVVVANIPNVNAIPFLTYIGPIVSSLVPWYQVAQLGVTGLVYQKTGEVIGTGVADSTSLRNGTALISLRASTYAAFIGQNTGKYYRDLGVTQLPAGIDTTKPFGFHPQNPWPNSLILDPVEINIAQTAVADYNLVIENAASTSGFAIVDMNTIFNTIRQSGYQTDGLTFTTTYVTGGLFSLDGVHPTSQGHAIIANEFIKAINSTFNANIPRINVATIPASLPLVAKISFIDGYPQIDPKAFDHLLY